MGVLLAVVALAAPLRDGRPDRRPAFASVPSGARDDVHTPTWLRPLGEIVSTPPITLQLDSTSSISVRVDHGRVLVDRGAEEEEAPSHFAGLAVYFQFEGSLVDIQLGKRGHAPAVYDLHSRRRLSACGRLGFVHPRGVPCAACWAKSCPGAPRRRADVLPFIADRHHQPLHHIARRPGAQPSRPRP